MGMLMHHTWLKQQEEENKAGKHVTASPVEKAETETKPEESVNTPVRRGRGRKPMK